MGAGMFVSNLQANYQLWGDIIIGWPNNERDSWTEYVDPIFGHISILGYVVVEVLDV